MSKKPVYSHSALEMFHGGDMHGGCPWAYKKIRIDKIARVTSEPLITGQVLHELTAKYLNRLIAQGLQTDWGWAQDITPKEAPADVFEVWPRFVENFILPPMESPGIEKQIAFNRKWEPCGYWDEDVYFRMVLDLTFLQGGLAVVKDWKSNRAVMRQIEKNLQLRTYGWGACRALYPGAQEILMQLHFMRYGFEPEPILLTPDDLATVPQELDAKIAEIEADKHFDPRPGSYCSWCGVQSHCPVVATALVPFEVLAPATREQAERTASLLMAMEVMDKAIKARLKEWVQVNGPVQVNDMIYGPSISTSYDLDPEAITAKLLADGLDPGQVWPLLSTTKTALERGLKKLKRQDLLGGILASAPSKEVEKIGFHKVKEA